VSRTVAFDGINAGYVSMLAAAGIDADNVGDAVAISANNTVGLGNDGDQLFGKIIAYEDDGVVTVQCRGYMEFDVVDGSEPSLGGMVLVNGAGKVKTAGGAIGRGICVTVDAANDTCGIIL
jgi:hypothetical protein